MVPLCDQPISKNHQKILNCKFKVQGMLRQKFFWKMKFKKPKFCWEDQVKFEFWSHLEVKKEKTQITYNRWIFLGLWNFANPLKSSVIPRRR